MANALALTTRNVSVPKPVPEVPAFLNKLYTMVDESSTDHIIKWADDGESFYILNAEDLGKYVLGQWFKHTNFASFVRQLNMYGFHKMQQMKQGALKSANETEVWQFQEPNFRRGCLELLKLITRKKNAGVANSNAALPSTKPTRSNDEKPQAIEYINDSSESNANPSTSAPGPLALQSLAGELTSIKRNQSGLLTDIKQLQISNNQLWKETVASQQTQKKQQDTIERILKFLAGVFGNSARNAARDVRSEDAQSVRSPSPAPRQNGLLLLENSKRHGRTRAAQSDSPELDTHRFTETTTPLDTPTQEHDENASLIEEIGDRPSSTPALGGALGAMKRSNSSLTRRNPPLPVSLFGRSPSPQPAALDGSSAGNLNASDFSAAASLAELFGTSPNLLISALSQLQQQQQHQNSNSSGNTVPLPETSGRFDYSDPGGLVPEHFSGNSTLSAPTSFDTNTFLNDPLPPLSPRLAYPQQQQNFDPTPSLYPFPNQSQNQIYRPYTPDLLPSLSESSADLNGVVDSAEGIQSSVDNAQNNLEALVRELVKLNPDYFGSNAEALLGASPKEGGWDPNWVNDFPNGLEVDDGTPRLQEADDQEMDDIGLPSVQNAVANAAANAATGNAGTGGENPLDIDSIISSLETGDGNDFNNNNGGDAGSSSSGTTPLFLPQSRFVEDDTSASNGAPTAQDANIWKLSNGVMDSLGVEVKPVIPSAPPRPKRKSDASLRDESVFTTRTSDLPPPSKRPRTTKRKGKT